jgi:hypothetical protein
MSKVVTYYDEAGKIDFASPDLTSKQFYADNITVLGPLEVLGNVPEVFDFPTSLAVHFTVGGYEDGLWLDETGGGNSLEAKS